MQKLQFQEPKSGKSIQPANSSTKTDLSLCLKSKNIYKFLSTNSYLPSVAAVADYFPCSRSTINRNQKKGLLKKYEVLPGRYIFLKSELRNAIQKNKRLKNLSTKNLLKKSSKLLCKSLKIN